MTFVRTHTPGWPDDSLDLDCTDVGDTVCLTPLYRAADPTQGTDRERIGYFFCHDVPGGDARCVGSVHTVATRPNDPTWSESGSLEAGTLTLTPSVNCLPVPGGKHEREFHGWVRDGRWVPA
jgi:hypothetical protein